MESQENCLPVITYKIKPVTTAIKRHSAKNCLVFDFKLKLGQTLKTKNGHLSQNYELKTHISVDIY